ncbi:MAG: hypothetical protein ABIR54_00180 [Burkholderiaceae bacterium]
MQITMKRWAGHALATGTCAALLACASGVSISDTWVQAYPGARRSPDEVAAVVRAGSPNLLTADFPSQIDSVNYADFRGLQLNGIEVLPGEHLVTLECSKGRRVKTATPSARINFIAGHVYQASCRDYGKSAGAEIEDLGVGYSGPSVPRHILSR